MVQAGVYAGLLHYFKALEALGGNPHDGIKVVDKMKSIPTDDPLFGKGEIEPNGRTIHSAYLFEVKKPSESKAPWDFYKLVGTVPGDQAFTPLDKSTCALAEEVTTIRRHCAAETFRVTTGLSARRSICRPFTPNSWSD